MSRDKSYGLCSWLVHELRNHFKHRRKIMFDTMCYKNFNGVRAFRRWVIPYVASRINPNEFRPIICYLYTEYHCNIDCHYCYQYDNNRQGMDLDTAKSAIDWLKSIGCRVIPLMGGEPLMRKDFILAVIR